MNGTPEFVKPACAMVLRFCAKIATTGAVSTKSRGIKGVQAVQTGVIKRCHVDTVCYFR